jgi:hypothetical protein
MTFAEYWIKKLAATPDLRDEDAAMRMPVRAFQRELAKAFAAGAKATLEQAEAAKAFGDIPTGGGLQWKDWLNDILKQ